MNPFNQPNILGYRTLSEQEIQLINEAKKLSEMCGEFIAKLHGFPTTGHSPHMQGSGEDPSSHQPSLNKRWINIGSTDLQKGWMAVVRGIAQPNTF